MTCLVAMSKVKKMTRGKKSNINKHGREALRVSLRSDRGGALLGVIG